jgi:hypothetical protein
MSAIIFPLPPSLSVFPDYCSFPIQEYVQEMGFAGCRLELFISLVLENGTIGDTNRMQKRLLVVAIPLAT